VQQGATTGASSGSLTVDPSPMAEQQADDNARLVTTGAVAPPTSHGRSLQRKLHVQNPNAPIKNPGGKGLKQTNAVTVQNYLNELCRGGAVKVAGGTGEVQIRSSFCSPAALPPDFIGPLAPSAKDSSTPVGCGCICDLVASKNTWNILVDDDSWPHTVANDHDASVGKKPGGTGGTVTTPSPNSEKLWGAATASGKELDIDPWLVLGHEMCGHAWMMNTGSHAADEAAKRGEGGHQETVKRENELRAEHGIDLRGTFKDPNCGESYWRDKSAPGTVNWSSYHSVCEQWRKQYNAAHGTNYKITDKIP